MKKIMTVSLMAMMVVGAARADIASVGYVEDKLASKANVSDVTSISNKLGTIADGKTVVEMIEAAQTAASYDDTAVKGLISANAGAITALETKVGDSSVADQIDAVRATTFNDLTAEEQAVMFPTVDLTEEMIATSTIDLGGLANTNAAAIQDIKNSAVMKSGITPDKVTAYDGYGAKITANETAAANAQAAAEAAQGAATQALTDAKAYADSLAGNYDAAGSAATALTDAKTYADGKATAAETAAKAYADGLATNYDAAGSASAAEAAAKAYADSLAGNYDAAGSASAAEAAAKAYADGLAGNYDAKGSAATAKSEAIEAAKSAGDLAYAAKSYEDRVQANETAIAANKTATETNAASIAAMAQAGIKAEGTGDGTYALTMKVTDGVRTFQWDQIGY